MVDRPLKFKNKFTKLPIIESSRFFWNFLRAASCVLPSPWSPGSSRVIYNLLSCRVPQYLYTTSSFKRRVVLKQQFTIEKGYYAPVYNTPYSEPDGLRVSITAHSSLRLLTIIEPYLVEQERMANAQLLGYGSKHLEQNFFLFFSVKVWVPHGTQRFRNPARSIDSTNNIDIIILWLSRFLSAKI